MSRGRPRRRAKSPIARAWTSFLVCLRSRGQRRVRVILAAGLLGLVGSAVVALIERGPLPAVHDEFSYLLAADTFANGRLTNPTHPHWEHFETFHVLMEPTYASKYPPGQGLMLALGQRLTGSPAAGVWLGVGLMSAAISWMLFAWLPRQWAVLASLASTVHLAWLSYWGDSYWGGAVAATGGALAFGAYRRLESQPNALHGAVLGLGLAILAMSRPYEGGIAGVCIGSALGYRFATGRGAVRAKQVRALLPAVCVVGLTVLWLGYYNWRQTGSAIRSAYQLYQVQYSSNPLLLVGTSGRRPDYRHAEVRKFFIEWGEQRLEDHRKRLVVNAPLKIATMTTGILGVGTVALLGLPGVGRRRSLRFVLVTAAAVLGASLLTAASFPHYAAPAASLLYVVFGAALAHLHRKARRTRSINMAIVTMAMLVILAPAMIIQKLIEPRESFAFTRESIQSDLESRPEKALVVVKYGPDHNVHEEWVYNRAEIDAAKVVWARSMSAEKNQRLIDYFRDRAVYSLEPERGAELKPYTRDAAVADEPVQRPS